MAVTVTIDFPGVDTYTEKVLAYAPFGFWRLNETSGTNAADSSGNGYDGTYNGPTLAALSGPDLNPCPRFDGLNDYVNLNDAGLLSALSAAAGSAGTLMCWCKVNASGDWTDGNAHIISQFYVDGSNAVLLSKSSTNNTLRWYFISGGTAKEITNGGYSATGWFHVAITWDHAADEVKAYYDGVQVGSTQTGLSAWAGSVAVAALGFSSNAWSGYLALGAVFDSALDSATIAALASTAVDGALVDITSYTESINGSVGFFDPEAHFAQIGTCQLVVNNADRRFSPANTSGPYNGLQWINAKVTIVSGANAIFTGYIQSVEPESGIGAGGRKRCTIRCEDMLGWLSRAPLSLPLQESRSMAHLLKLIGSEVFKTDFATGTITFDGNVDDGDTITIGQRTYTFVASLSNAYQVLIGTTKEDTAVNLAAAINDDESAGDVYGVNTLRSPEVSAEADAGVITITALARGTAGNAIALSTVGVHHHANSLTETVGAIVAGTLADTDTQDGVYLQLSETAGTPGFDYQFDFTDVDGTPTGVVIYGRYDGSGGHTVNVDAYNWGGGSYDTLGTLASSGSDSEHTYTLTAAHVSSNAVRIRIQHVSPGNVTHNLYLDHLYVTATMPASIDEITLSGATLAGGTDGPDDFSYQDGVQIFDIAADAWSEERTNALLAFQHVIASEYGYGWCDKDGTLRAWDRNEEFKLPGQAATITLDNTHFKQSGEIGSAIYNASTVSYEPRGTVSNQVVAKANNVIAVPGSTEGVRWNRQKELYFSGQLGTLPAGVVTVRIPFVQEGTGGTIIGATEVIMPKRGDDYQINDQSDGSGFNYTNTFPPRITVSAVITGSGIECTFSNSALGTLYIIDFQVRGTAIIAYDRQQVIRQNSDSITKYGKRTIPYTLPLASGEIFAESLAHHLVGRHKDEKYRVPVATIHDATATIGGVDPLSIGIGDVASVTEDQTGVSAQKHIVRGIRFGIGAGGRSISLEWHLKAVLDQTYWILGDSTYGVLGSTTRLAI